MNGFLRWVQPGFVWGKKFWSLPGVPILLIVLLSTLVKIYYVFELTQYKEYLTSDMHGYWNRAVMRFSGDEFNPDQWSANATFYHMVLAFFFKLRAFFGLEPISLEGVLGLNIALSALSVVALYGIGLVLLKKRTLSLVMAGVYAFSFPYIYFNTFVLAEPLGIPLIMTGLWLMLVLRDRYWVWVAGLLVGLGVAVRPSNGLIGLPCGLYLLFWQRPTSFRQFVLRGVKAGLFSVAMLAVLASVMAENARISKGQVKGLTAHAGYNFYLGVTDAYKITSQYNGYTYSFVPSSVAYHPEKGTITTSIPIYDSERFSKLAWEYLADHPGIWLDKIANYKYLFFDNLFPSVPSCKGFEPLFDWSRYVIFAAFLLLGLLWVLRRRPEDVARADIHLFAGIFVVSALGLYMFTITHQYFYNFAYVVYVLFFVVVDEVVRKGKEQWRRVALYLASLGVLAGGVGLWGLIDRACMEEKVAIAVHRSPVPLFRLPAPAPESQPDLVLQVDRLNFPLQTYLNHDRLGRVGDFTSNFWVRFASDFEVLRPGIYRFVVYVDDGHALELDGKQILLGDGSQRMWDRVQEVQVNLSSGRHRLSGRWFQWEVDTGFIVYYLTPEAAELPVIRTGYDFVDPLKTKRYLVGEDSEWLVFDN